jgi:adenylyltransferase/sulfurtransferase
VTRDDRHSRSILFPGIGEEGQERIRRFSLAIVGVGAVGAASAELAARAGFGRLTVIDRDVVEESNLSRQLLFDADDVAGIVPKATAAEERLREIAPEVAVRGVVADLVAENARQLLGGHDLVLDGTDNFETRLLVSDAARSLELPSIYAACMGEEGLLAVSIPGSTPCLRCYLEGLPPAGSAPTCDTEGIVPTLPALVASLALTEAIRLATGAEPARGVLSVRVWQEGFRSARSFEKARPRPDCPVCSRAAFPALEVAGASEIVKLCGRRSVQVASSARERPDFDALEKRLARVARVRRSPQLLNADVDDISLTIFSDGRCVVRGTEDPGRARRLYDRYVGR